MIFLSSELRTRCGRTLAKQLQKLSRPADNFSSRSATSKTNDSSITVIFSSLNVSGWLYGRSNRTWANYSIVWRNNDTIRARAWFLLNWATSHENFVNICIFFNMSARQHWSWWCLDLYTQTLCLRLRYVFRHKKKDPVSFFNETLIQLPLSRCRQNTLREEKKNDDQATAIPYFSKVRGSHIITFSIHSTQTVTIRSVGSQLHPDVNLDEILAVSRINTHAQNEWAYIRPTHIWFSGVVLGLGSR